MHPATANVKFPLSSFSSEKRNHDTKVDSILIRSIQFGRRKLFLLSVAAGWRIRRLRGTAELP